MMNLTKLRAKPQYILFSLCTIACLAVFPLFVLDLQHKLPMLITNSSRTAFASKSNLPDLHMLIFSDKTSAEKYRNQTDHIECYAERHGYKFAMLPPLESGPCANLTNIFFKKHCAISFYLEAQEKDIYAFVLDNDVIPGAPNVPLTRWMRYQYDNDLDFVFYDRTWDVNVMAGIYLTRNTPLAIGWLRYWSSFDRVIPSGWHNWDNGANHLAMIDVLALEGRERCHALYHNITVHSEPGYWSYARFMACTRELLGPSGIYPIMSDGVRKGGFAIFPRFFAYALDPIPWSLTRVRKLFPFHHAYKAGDWEMMHMETHDDSVKCNNYTLNDEVSDAELAKRLREADKSMMAGGMMETIALVPRWSSGWLDPSCFDRLWCPPTPFSADWPPADVNKTKRVIKRPAIEPVNVVVRRIEAGRDMTILE